MSANVFRFSVKKGEGDTADKLVDMNAVEEVVRLSKEAAKVGKRMEKELAAQDVDIAAQNGIKPDAATLADNDIAYYGCIVGKKHIISYLRSKSSYRSNYRHIIVRQ